METKANDNRSARVFDSNALIYHLNDAYPPEQADRVDAWIDAGGLVSVVTRIEVLGFEQPTSEVKRARQLLTLFEERPLHEPVIQQTIALRREHSIRLPDAVIAATALDASLPLVTRNTDDFDAIDELELLDPFDD